MAQKDIGNKVPLHTLKKVEDVAAYYDEWALNNKYDKDMEAWNYTGPKETSETFNKYQKNKSQAFVAVEKLKIQRLFEVEKNPALFKIKNKSPPLLGLEKPKVWRDLGRKTKSLALCNVENQKSSACCIQKTKSLALVGTVLGSLWDYIGIMFG